MNRKTQLRTHGCIVFIFFAFLTQAQTVFRPEYIIDLKNDTLIGDIDYRGDELMGKRCVFKSKSTGVITEFSPSDIAAYRFNDDRFFIAKDINAKKVFLEFLIKGKVNIYYLRDGVGEHFFIDKLGEKMEELPFKEEIVYNDGAYLKTSNIHKSILKKYMKDAVGFQTRINKLEKPEHGELISLAKDYHNQVCKDESCIIYKKKTALTVDLEALGGFIQYGSSELVVQKTYAQFGILAHFWLPRVNEKLYLRMGFVYSSVGIVYGTEIFYVNVYKVPIQIEYVYPKGKIRPVLLMVSTFFNLFITPLVLWAVSTLRSPTKRP